MRGSLIEQYFRKGWCVLPFESKIAEWVEYALPYARQTLVDPDQAQWHRCGGTWFAGVNALPNTEKGALDDGPDFDNPVSQLIRKSVCSRSFEWDRGQISVCYPDYPKPMENETDAAYNYRLNRDAAHIDGLLPEGPERRRHLREYHGFILGIPLVQFPKQASPLVVWEESHKIVQGYFQDLFQELTTDQWGNIDITDQYHELRRSIFETCNRVELHCSPGECLLVHRLALHGVAPWKKGVEASKDGRMICYFRPDIGSAEYWLNDP